MSAYGFTVTLLATGLADAVAKDEAPEVGGFDLSAGMFGPNISEWVRGVAKELDDRRRQVEILHAERDHARARVDATIKLLTGIHALLYPSPITTTAGRVMVFRPKNLDPHEVLQELSERIRALPDQLFPVATVPANPNTGHGHVRPRPDGVRMRRGGPAMCSVCALELAQFQRAQCTPQPADQQPDQPASPKKGIR